MAKKTSKPKKTIAQRAAAKKSGQAAFVLRWLLMLPLAFIWFVFTFLMAGYSFTALVCACLIGVLLFYNICYLTREKFPKLTKVVKRVFTILLCIGLLVVGITECLIIHASFGDKDETCDYMLVLGAKVRNDGPSVSLMDRIKATAAYMEDHPEVIAVVSGGKGPDEPMTEAQCMYEQLVKLGVDPERIWLEDKALNTKQNIRYSMALIEEKTGQRPEYVGILSSDTHLLRANLLARRQDVKSFTIPAASTMRSSFLKHFLREIFVIWYYALIGL